MFLRLLKTAQCHCLVFRLASLRPARNFETNAIFLRKTFYKTFHYSGTFPEGIRLRGISFSPIG